MAKKTAATEPKIPHLADHPDYAKAASKVSELRARIAEVRERTREIEAQLAKRTSEEAAAAALLDGEQETAERTAAGASAESLNAERHRLDREERLLHRAVEMAEQRVMQARTDVTAPLLEPLMPHWRELLRRKALALVELVAAMDLEATFVRELLMRDFPISATVHSFGVPLSGSNPHDRTSLIVERVGEALELGALKLAEVEGLTRSEQVLSYWRSCAEAAK